MKRILLGIILPLAIFVSVKSVNAADKSTQPATPAAMSMADFDVKKAIESGDHAGLAKFYRAQAEVYRQKAASHDTMEEEYKKSHVHYKGMENNMAAHCSILKEKALKTAKDYEKLAEEEEKLAGMSDKK